MTENSKDIEKGNGVLMLLDSSNTSTGVDERQNMKLALEKAQEELQLICASHAGTFVAVEHRSEEWMRNLKQLKEKLSGLEIRHAQEVKPIVQDHRWKELCEEHRTRRRTLLQHAPLLELLELPSLMDACVRGQLYQDALNLAQLAMTLQQQEQSTATHNESKIDAVGDGTMDTAANPIVQRVVQDVLALAHTLQKNLLHRFTQPNVSMPLCLELITALRRWNGIQNTHESMEWKLQVDFLEARDVWVTSIPLPTDTYYSLLDYIDAYRTRVFEVATQYLAIFSTRKHLLRMWVMRRVQSFIQLLANTPLITDISVLANVWEASTFFASCVASLQCNFAPLLIPVLLDNRLMDLLSRTKWTLQGLKETLQLSREHNMPNLICNSLFTNNHNNSSSSNDATNVNFQEGPPKELLQWPPLARWLNTYLTGLNELRRCLIPSIFPSIRKLHSERKDQVLLLLQQHVTACKRQSPYSKLSTLSVDMVQQYQSIVVPYMDFALERALGTILPPPKGEVTPVTETTPQEEVTKLEENEVTDETESKEEEGITQIEDKSEGLGVADNVSKEEETVSEVEQ